MACQGLAEALSKKHNVTFVLPKLHETASRSKVNLVDLSSKKIDPIYISGKTSAEEFVSLNITELILPYLPPRFFRTQDREMQPGKVEDSAIKLLDDIKLSGTYSEGLLNELKKYGLLVFQFASKQSYDIVHAHDWLTLEAGLLIQDKLGIPCIAHIHSCEHDRNGSFADHRVVDIEMRGLRRASAVVTVSQVTKNKLINHYGIDENKITVIPNGQNRKISGSSNKGTNTIGFIGRFADQKAPGRFIDIVRELITLRPEINFSMAGDGYLMESVQNKIKQVNIKKHAEILGFLSAEKVRRWMSKMSVIIAPSISEPFGLVVLEAIGIGVPVVVSKNSGIAEFIPDLIQIDHWDIHSFASMTEKLISDHDFRNEYVENCQSSARELTWKNSATLMEEVYHSIGK